MGITFTASDLMIAGATLLGPILAVQAQQWVERAREYEGRKGRVFSTLMATRAARLSPEHVRALNAIDLTYAGRRTFWRDWQTAREARVIAAWREYFTHLDNKFPVNGSIADQSAWATSADELFMNLLFAMAQESRFNIDRATLKQGHYSPTAHGNTEQENAAMRRALMEILAGRGRVPVEIYPGVGVGSQQPAPTSTATPNAHAG